MRQQPAVFLDRDGVLNVERSHISRPEQLEMIAGVPEALKQMKAEGFLLVVITNQAVIARGGTDEAGVGEIHAHMTRQLEAEGAFLDAIYYCPHHPGPLAEGARIDLIRTCDCRKPATGLVEQACNALQIDLEHSWMVGDHTRDIEMARRAGLRSVLVRTGHAGRDGEYSSQPTVIADDLRSAARAIIEQHRLSPDAEPARQNTAGQPLHKSP